jgi:toxin ParE1/3/4
MRARKLLLSPRAEADLVDIGSYIADDNPARAMSFILELRDFMQKVAANPFIGRPRDDLRMGLRSVPFIGYNYVIYYRVISQRAGIKVERVLHGARDVGRLL